MVKYGILHAHSMYSLFDSTQTLDEMLQRCQILGCKNITLTDHGTLLGAIPFLKKAQEYNINGIPGVEGYVGDAKAHMIFVPMNYQGFQAISRMMREANTNQIIAKFNSNIAYPIINDDFKEVRNRDDIIVTSACISGPLGIILLHNFYKKEALEKISKKQVSLQLEEDLWNKENEACLSLEAEKRVINKQIKQEESYRKAPFKNKLKKAKESVMVGRIGAKEAYEEQLLLYERSSDNVSSLKNKRNMIMVELKAFKAERQKYDKAHNRYKKLTADKEMISSELVSDESLYQEAFTKALEYKKIFPRFYIELQNHGLPQEALIMPLLARIAEETNIPVIAANDAHMPDNSISSIRGREVLRYNYFKKHQTLNQEAHELYLKSDEELFEALRKILPEHICCQAMENLKILTECKIVEPSEKHYPALKDSEKLFQEILEEKRQEMISSNSWNDEYEKRLKYEIEIITSMGYIDYHMVVRDFCNMARLLGGVPKDKIDTIPNDFSNIQDWVKENNYQGGIGVGPGRGSAAGSLVCYMLGITNLDPLKYGLLFERFLNPERISMPDIDSDIKTSLRGTIIRYLKWRYGNKAVCSIATETTYAAKGAIQLAGRDKISELYGDTAQEKKATAKERKALQRKIYAMSDIIVTGNSIQDHNKEINDAFNSDVIMMEILNNAKLLEGKLFTIGVHAGGVIISDNDNVNDYIPLAWNDSKNVWVAQCDMNECEAHGLLKMDLLGLSTLDCIADCLDLIYKQRGEVIDVENLPFHEKVFQRIYSMGLTNSVFQFESDGMKSMLKDFKPSCFTDLILLVAAYRPGPMQYLQNIIDRKHGREKITYAIPELEPILNKTYGAIIYQEQVMKIFQALAGYSLGGADMVRRAMSKKKLEKLEIERQAFVYGDTKRKIRGCQANGIDVKEANKLFDEMMAFASYAFNQSHAAVYAYVSYITAYLKCFYPTEFLCAMFNNKEIKNYAPLIEDANNLNIELLPPSITKSKSQFVIENCGIRWGFQGIKGLGEQSIKSLKNEPDPYVHDFYLANTLITEKTLNETYLSFEDFILSNTKWDKGKVITPPDALTETLIKVGAFDVFCANRKVLIEYHADLIKFVKKCNNVEEFFSDGCDLDTTNLKPDTKYNQSMEIEFCGAMLSSNPLSSFVEKHYKCKDSSNLTPGEKQSILAYINSEKDIAFVNSRKTSKTGMIVTVYTKKGNVKVMLWGRSYNKYASDISLYVGVPLKLYLSVSDKDALFVDEIEKLLPDSKNLFVSNVPSEVMKEYNQILFSALADNLENHEVEYYIYAKRKDSTQKICLTKIKATEKTYQQLLNLGITLTPYYEI